MKTTPFTDIHIALGAKMHEFAGYNMPIEYNGIKEEHMNVVNNVGVFDVSHMGEFWVKGPKALEFLQKVSSNDASKLAVGQIQYSCFPTENGGILDDFLLYRYEEDKYMMVPNAANVEKDWAWCVKHNTMGAELVLMLFSLILVTRVAAVSSCISTLNMPKSFGMSYSKLEKKKVSCPQV